MPAAEAPVLAEIAALKPDVLWEALGVPRDRAFCERHRAALAGVGASKMMGDLSDGLARAERRAVGPAARYTRRVVQAGVRTTRLFARSFVTGPHALLATLRTIR